MCVLVQGWQPCLAQVLRGVNLTNNKCNVSAERAVAGSTNESTSPSVDPSLSLTHTNTTVSVLWKLAVLSTRIDAYCERVRAHTHTILMHSHPPSINKLHQMLSANTPCKRERALHHGSAVSSQGWQLHKKAWNNLPGFHFFFRLPYKTNCDKDTQGRKERNKENKFFKTEVKVGLN